DPAHSGALNELGRISLRSRDTAAAAEHFLRAARISPRNDVFGRNSELALRRISRRLAALILLALAILAAIAALAATGHRTIAAAVATPPPRAPVGLPADPGATPGPPRRHLPRLLIARQRRLARSVTPIAITRAAAPDRGQKNPRSPEDRNAAAAGSCR